ncbi:uncharacterized protein PFLUO_LOCUS1478 [Penicillium psychrofluorescens]|uniref:uncharacterized protein n=1 Tax=Penicillium psychrofluorescens TaxID=3158075 RepID=UPI003CCDE187
MKGAILATTAALMGSALAAENVHRRHDALHNRRAVAYTPSSESAWPSSSVWSSAPAWSTPYNPGGPAEETCGCVTKTITYLGSPTLVPVPETSSTVVVPETTSTVKLTTTIQSTAYSTYTVTVSPSSTWTPTPSPVVTLPTPHVTTFPSTGTYTIPATTVVVTDTTTVCGATSTSVPSGTHTIGGTTTVVTTETTITCPYATVKPSGSTVTSVVEMTTYTCPAAGTYTVVPATTTVVPSPTVIVWPTPQTITPGTFTQPEQTVTVVETDYTYVCPFATPTPSAPAWPSSVAAETTTAPATPQPTGGSGSGVLTGKGQYGMTYSPYTNSGMCKTKDEVFQDVKTIQDKGFDLVRIYSTDCSGLMFVGEAARQYGMNMILGVYIDNTGTSGAQEQVSAIATWAEWDLVELIVVGNEAVQSGYVSASELATFIESSTAIFRAAGWTKDVTTTEPIDVWQQYGASTLCGAVDIVGANIHPFFNSETTAEQAGEFALSEYKILQSICPGKDVLNLETGWPNGGESNGAAIPGQSEQNIAIHSIAKYIGSKSIFFSFANDQWKSPGAFAVEQHWGCSDVFH